MKLHTMVAQLENEAIRVRRELHRIPELGYEERKTQAYILDYLSKQGPDSLEKMASTGVKAVFYAKEPTGTVAFRADIDALAIQEENEVAYASQHPDRMHACGHDGHTTVLLMLARLLSHCRDRLRYNVVLIFQPAEEGVGGAKRMIDEGVLKNPDVERIYGLHVWPDVPLGKIGLREGPMMAQTLEFEINVHGKSAHGASPHKGIDSIVVSAEIIGMIQTVLTRSINPEDRALITIGRIQGGESHNIIAQHVHLSGTIRSFSNTVTQEIQKRIQEILSGMEVASGVRTSFIERMRYPVLENPVHMTEQMAEIMEYTDIVVVDEQMAAEDFSFFQQNVPGLYFFVGVGGPQSASLHNPKFDFDEKALLMGVEIFRRILGIS